MERETNHVGERVMVVMVVMARFIRMAMRKRRRNIRSW